MKTRITISMHRSGIFQTIMDKEDFQQQIYDCEMYGINFVYIKDVYSNKKIAINPKDILFIKFEEIETKTIKDKIQDLIKTCNERICVLTKCIKDLGLTAGKADECCFISRENMMYIQLYEHEIKDLERFISTLYSILSESEEQ